MKKILATLCLVSLFLGTKAQTFTFVPADTIKYDNPGNVLYCSDSIKNNSSTGYYVDVIRVLNDTAPNWETSFCLDVCYPPSVDSARFYLLPNGVQMFLLDFYSDTIPDTSTVLMKFINVSTPSNVVYQKFYGITVQGLGVNTVANQTSVKIFPSPVIAGNTFCFRISDKQNISEDFTLLLYDVFGKKSCILKNLVNGDNYLALNLSEGLYVYNLLSGQNCLKTGKIAVVK